MTLVGTTYRNMESIHSCRTTYMMRIKESERRPEIVTEIEEWEQKVPGVCVKSFSRVLLSVLETSVVS